MSSLGERLRQARERLNLSQTDVCRRLKISNSTLSGYERNYRKPDAEMIKTFAELYGVSTDYLLGNTNSLSQKSTGHQDLTEKDEKDIARRMEKIKQDLAADGGLSFYGEPLSEEAKESLLEAMEYAVRQAQRINKKFVPKKYKEEPKE